MALRRGIALSEEALQVFATDLCDLDASRFAEADVFATLDKIGRAEPEDFEPRFPAIGTIKRLIEEQARDRRIAESKAKRLTDGRRPGEDELAYAKRRCEEDNATPDPAFDAQMAAHLAKLSARTNMNAKPAVKSTPAPEVSTPPQSRSIRDMHPLNANRIAAAMDLLADVHHEEQDDLRIAFSLLSGGPHTTESLRLLAQMVRRLFPEAATAPKNPENAKMPPITH